jgi:citrate lyase subunit beta/citryl-CoA lyase
MGTCRQVPGTTWLFVPGDRPDRFAKAASAGADEVVIDLEDAVAPTSKPVARGAVVDWLSEGGQAWVRVNATDTEWHQDDLQAVVGAPGLRGLILPKLESAEKAEGVRTVLPAGLGLVGLIETARGVLGAEALADSGVVDRLALGTIDLALDLGATDCDQVMLHPRSVLVHASRAAGLPGPVDGVTTVCDDGVVAAAAHRARTLGFGGKFCIHPRQVDLVRAGFAPNEDELRWASRIEEAARCQDAGTFAVDGQMIDRPVLTRAREILARR